MPSDRRGRNAYPHLPHHKSITCGIDPRGFNPAHVVRAVNAGGNRYTECSNVQSTPPGAHIIKRLCAAAHLQDRQEGRRCTRMIQLHGAVAHALDLDRLIAAASAFGNACRRLQLMPHGSSDRTANCASPLHAPSRTDVPRESAAAA